MATKMKKVPSFLINCLLIFSCEAQEKTESQRFLEEFDDSFPLFKNGRWEVLVEWFDERELTINATKNSGDTLLSVRVHKHLISKDSVIVSFIDASRIFNQNASMIDYQRLDQNLDIMYWYKFDSINEDKKSFIAGKYYYQYLEGFLSKKQRDLFLKHSDSLKLVKGDNLTEIPEY